MHVLQDPNQAVANTVRSGSAQVDVVWRPSGLSHSSWPDVAAGPLTSKPLVLLVNSNTASASEVLAGEGGDVAYLASKGVAKWLARVRRLHTMHHSMAQVSASPWEVKSWRQRQQGKCMTLASFLHCQYPHATACLVMFHSGPST